MAKYCYLLILCICTSFSLSFVRTEVPKNVERKLRRDAARLALRIEAQSSDARYAPVYIPEATINALYKALASVYVHAEEGEALYRCNIHTYPNPSIDHLVLIYDRNIDWAEPLREGLAETDNIQFNALLQKYNILIDRHVQWTESQDALTLRSRQPINMAAIAAEFEAIEGIQSIDLGIPKILGNDIEAHRIEGAWNFDYILRFGAWATGSGQSHTWRFTVTDKGQVESMGEMGDVVPKWMRCRFGSDKFLSKL